MAYLGDRLPGSLEDENNNKDKAYGVPKKLLALGSVVFFILGGVVLYFSIKAHQPLAIALGVMMWVAAGGYLLILKFPDKPTHAEKAAAEMKKYGSQNDQGYQPPYYPQTKKKKKRR